MTAPPEVSLERALVAGWEGAKRNWAAFVPILLLSAASILPLWWLWGRLGAQGVLNANFLTAVWAAATKGDPTTLTALLASLFLMVYATLLAVRWGLDARDLPTQRATIAYTVGSWFVTFLWWALAWEVAESGLELLTAERAWWVFLLALLAQLAVVVRLQFVPFFIVEGTNSPWGAVASSWRLTAGHFWLLLWFLVLAFAIGVAGLLVLFVGVFFALPMATIAQADLFRQLSGPPAPAAAGAGGPTEPSSG